MQCMKVSTLVSGEINCVDLKALLLAHKDKPAIINLNIGILRQLPTYIITNNSTHFLHKIYRHLEKHKYGSCFRDNYERRS